MRAKRRHRDREDVQTKEEVGPELMFLDLLLEIAVGRGDDANVDTNIRRSADAPEAFLLEKPQQFGLEPGGHLADLVEKYGPAISGFEQSLLLHARVGERAALVTEELAFE